MSESHSREKLALGDLGPGSISGNSAIILVEPKDARNIGAVARAMSNLGFSHLRLVSPQPFDTELACAVACWGEDLVRQARTFSHLKDAISDMHEVVGFASDSSEHRVTQVLLDDWVASLEFTKELAVGFVFGSEENGLRREHFPLCQHLVRIPSAQANRSYNLAQAVLLALYAVRNQEQESSEKRTDEYVTSSQLEVFTEMVLRVAEEVQFLNENSPEHMKNLLTNLTRRGRFNTKELKILTGLVGQVWKGLKS